MLTHYQADVQTYNNEIYHDIEPENPLETPVVPEDDTNQPNNNNQSPQIEPNKSRYGCTLRPTQKYQDYQENISQQEFSKTITPHNSSKEDPSAYFEIDKTAEYDHPIVQ
jgi:biopolymer transport protein ExbD